MDYMMRALELASRARGNTGSNPAVGAVLVKNGRIVGEGYTQPPGQAHAEIVALAQAGPEAIGAALYVTLEPCCHHGRTPPCTDALIAAGVSEVHMAMVDPNPLVSGGGKAALEAAGIVTVLGEREAEARRALEAWLVFITRGRPMITAKYAMSLDGKIATSAGESKWITGTQARRQVHRLRAASDGVIVGVNTVVVDDPQLTARDESGQPLLRQPLRLIVDSTARVPLSAQVVSGRLPGTTVVISGPRADEEKLACLRDRGNIVIVVPERNGRVDLGAALTGLAAEFDMTTLLAEGGGELLGSLFDLGLVDKVVAFVAPLLIGGAHAPGPLAGHGVASMGAAVRLRDVWWEQVGHDLMIVGYVARGGEEKTLSGANATPLIQAGGAGLEPYSGISRGQRSDLEG